MSALQASFAFAAFIVVCAALMWAVHRDYRRCRRARLLQMYGPYHERSER